MSKNIHEKHFDHLPCNRLADSSRHILAVSEVVLGGVECHMGNGTLGV
jgi:hypothetical protein